MNKKKRKELNEKCYDIEFFIVCVCAHIFSIRISFFSFLISKVNVTGLINVCALNKRADIEKKKPKKTKIERS